MERGKLYLHDAIAGRIEIDIAGNKDLTRMQDQLRTKIGKLLKDVDLGEFYKQYNIAFPPNYNPGPNG